MTFHVHLRMFNSISLKWNPGICSVTISQMGVSALQAMFWKVLLRNPFEKLLHSITGSWTSKNTLVSFVPSEDLSLLQPHYMSTSLPWDSRKIVQIQAWQWGVLRLAFSETTDFTFQPSELLPLAGVHRDWSPLRKRPTIFVTAYRSALG